jgi:GntR family transcriptional regulator
MNSANLNGNITFSLDSGTGVPIYRQIIRQIEHAVLSERMKPGDRLPTIRSLAVDLKINPNTIAKAYNELEIKGILVTQVGSGTYISNKKPAPEEDRRKQKILEILNCFMQEMKRLGVDKKELLTLLDEWSD